MENLSKKFFMRNLQIIGGANIIFYTFYLISMSSSLFYKYFKIEGVYKLHQIWFFAAIALYIFIILSALIGAYIYYKTKDKKVAYFSLPILTVTLPFWTIAALSYFRLINLVNPSTLNLTTLIVIGLIGIYIGLLPYAFIWSLNSIFSKLDKQWVLIGSIFAALTILLSILWVSFILGAFTG